MIGPEAKFLNYEKIKSEVDPANRGNRQYFGNCPHHHSVSYSTDMPTASMGKWILDKIDEMSPAHINLIRTLYLKLQEYKRKPLTDHVMRMIKEYQRDLDLARRYQPPIKPLPGKQRNIPSSTVNMMCSTIWKYSVKTSFGRCTGTRLL